MDLDIRYKAKFQQGNISYETLIEHVLREIKKFDISNNNVIEEILKIDYQQEKFRQLCCIYKFFLDQK